jgi:succinate dehydrogenase / fumarate reductase cytochrome b subunit
MLTIQNKKARPVNYAYSHPSANSSLPSRWMAVLGTLILVFIATHMANFWWKMKIKEDVPLHTYKVYPPITQNPNGEDVYYTLNGQPIPVNQTQVKNHTEIHIKDMTNEMAAMGIKPLGKNHKLGEAYKDLYTVVIQFFSKSNSSALLGVIFYTISMLVLGFHLWHGFASAFQSLGVNHAKWNPLIKGLGKGFAVIVPALFAIIPILIYLKS